MIPNLFRNPQWAIEEAARVSGSAQMTIFAHMGLCAHVIEKNGTDDQKSKFLPGKLWNRLQFMTYNSGET